MKKLISALTLIAVLLPVLSFPVSAEDFPTITLESKNIDINNLMADAGFTLDLFVENLPAEAEKLQVYVSVKGNDFYLDEIIPADEENTEFFMGEKYCTGANP